jgi:hypothetical protein
LFYETSRKKYCPEKVLSGKSTVIISDINEVYTYDFTYCLCD